ncbi:MAG: SIR2 family protein [Chloroflexi bacterium]|nr:SIR2 family protein [Chloroflexota bacterium]
MKLGQIDFPPELIGAIRDGELVVFAGAGVSKGDPACLPLFKELACKIAEGSGETREPSEAIDQFLGRLVSGNGINVHEIAARVLTETNPEPTELHRDLLRLFKGEAGAVQLVTTNFDLLFEAAANELFGSDPTVFRASALPRGDEFTGIVHVHGDVTVDTDMVLTDEDFGRAYLTGGWARRFLVALFQNKPVLFVGYSHSDTIMEYLARAIPVSPDIPRRFILTHDQDGSKWSRLHIQPILFPPLDFQAQDEGVAKLAATVNRGAADWRDMIRNTVMSQPAALSDEDADVLHFGLNDAGDSLSNVRVFTNYAQSFEWVTWLDQRGLLNHLFDEDEFDEKDSMYAGWIASNFARQDADSVFRLIGQKDLRLHSHFWSALAFQVGSSDQTSLIPESLGKWVSIFLSKAVGATHDDFTSIFERCVELGRLEDALDILEVVARPRVTRVTPSDDDLLRKTEVSIGSDEWHLAQMMSGLQPHLPEVAERLVGIATRNLAVQHRQLATWDLADRDFSQPSIHRATIEGEVETTKLSPEDVLIDMARNSIVWLARNEPGQAEVWIERLSSSDIPLLRRLSRFAVAELPE